MAIYTVAPGQIVSGKNYVSGDTITISSGGTLIDTNFAAGVIVAARAGAILSGTMSNAGSLSGGTLIGPNTTLINALGGRITSQTVGSGAILTTEGSLTSVTLGSGGVINQKSGTITDLSIDGGTINCYLANKMPSFTFTSNGGVGNIITTGRDSQGANITGPGTVCVQNGAVVAHLGVGPQATLMVAKGGWISGTNTVSSGGTLILEDGAISSDSITLDGNGATVVVNGKTMPSAWIDGWSENDRIILNDIPRSSIVKAEVGSSRVTFYTKDGSSYVLLIYTASSLGYSLTEDEYGHAVFLTCFAEGTLIATPSGEVAVELLVEGQLIHTPKGPMPVKWIGHRKLEVLKQPVPEECWLVRICKGALADNVPARDLLVTQEHCMVFEGQLVPARMLVNDQSIFLDRSITEYRYFHVELGQHEAIWAEGALTESYLDTGNRDQFSNAPVTILSPKFRASGSPTMPLATSREFVEPVYEALLSRLGRSIETPVLLEDPQLHLVTEDGVVVRPARNGPGGYVFMIPASVEVVKLMSRIGCPATAIGPYVDDRRMLGVAVEEILLFSTSGMQPLDEVFMTPVLEGWHEVEGEQHRWTNGAGSLPLGSDDMPRVLHVKLAAVGPYAEVGANENLMAEDAIRRQSSI